MTPRALFDAYLWRRRHRRIDPTHDTKAVLGRVTVLFMKAVGGLNRSIPGAGFAMKGSSTSLPG